MRSHWAHSSAVPSWYVASIAFWRAIRRFIPWPRGHWSAWPAADCWLRRWNWHVARRWWLLFPPRRRQRSRLKWRGPARQLSSAMEFAHQRSQLRRAAIPVSERLKPRRFCLRGTVLRRSLRLHRAGQWRHRPSRQVHRSVSSRRRAKRRVRCCCGQKCRMQMPVLPAKMQIPASPVSRIT